MHTLENIKVEFCSPELPVDYISIHLSEGDVANINHMTELLKENPLLTEVRSPASTLHTQIREYSGKFQEVMDRDADEFRMQSPTLSVKDGHLLYTAVGKFDSRNFLEVTINLSDLPFQQEEDVVPKAVVIVEGGVVRKIITDSKIDIRVLDFDIEGLDANQVRISNRFGEEVGAYLHERFKVANDPEFFKRLISKQP